MIKIKCPVCEKESYYKSSAADVIRLLRGEIVELQCGDEVRALGRSSEPEEADAPYAVIEVFGVGRER